MKKQTIKNNAFYIYINLNNYFCRTEGSSKVALATRPLTPVEINKQKKSPVKVKNPPAAQISPPSHTNSPSVTPVNLPQDESSKGRLLLLKNILQPPIQTLHRWLPVNLPQDERSKGRLLLLKKRFTTSHTNSPSVTPVNLLQDESSKD